MTRIDTSPIVLYRGSELDDKPEELQAMRQYFECTPNRTLIDSNRLVIGRYSVLPFYKDTEADIKALGSTLINTYTQHQFIADLGNYAEILHGLTPTSWRDLSQVDQDGPYILKGATNSAKFLWDTHMFASNKKEAQEVLIRLQQDSLIGTQDIYIRKYVPLKTYFISIRDLPITDEYRFFICDGKVLCGAYYWSSFAEDFPGGKPPTADCVPQSLLDEVISRVGDRARFYVVDVAQTRDGDWIVIELNDGQMSGLSENDPSVLYRNLKSVLAE